MIRRFNLIPFIAVLAVQVHGQWVTQQLDLHSGWNSVYLTIQPVPASCSELFSGTFVQSVSWWSRTTGQAEFDSDPQQTFPRSPNWRNWYADESRASTFGSLICGEAYMIKVKEGTAPFTLTITGVPRLGKGKWLAGEYNFTGLPVPEGNTLSFSHFFRFTDQINAVDDNDIYEVLEDGSYSPIFRPALTSVEHGRAYWIRGGAHRSDYYGPVMVRLLSASPTLDFSKSFAPRKLEIENTTDQTRVVTIRHVDSAVPPWDGEFPAVAGRVPLNVARFSPTNRFLFEEYVPLPDLIVTNIPAGDRIILKLLPSLTPDGGLGEGEAWQSILQISDEGNDGKSEATVVHAVGVFWDGAVADHTGLWVGSVAVTEVNRAQTQAGVSNTWDHTAPVPVVRPYVFRLIVHLDEEGEVHLLQRVLPAWIPDGEIVVTGEGLQTNGIYELFTDERFAEQCLADHPQAKISRISSVNLPLMDPVPMMGNFGGTNALSCTVLLPFDDPVNPFVHRYHPMHDNLEYNNDGSTSPLGDGEESFSITRFMRFAFAQSDPERGAGNPLWGISEVGGTFTERVNGLNKTIYVRGQFRLQKVNDCGVLDYLNQP